MPEDSDMIHRIGREVRDHGTRLELHEERIRGIERLCDADADGDLRRRVERVEGILAEHQALMRESTLMIARLNETLMDLKSELSRFRETEKAVERMAVSLRAVNWLGGIVVTTAVAGIIAYLFKVPV